MQGICEGWHMRGIQLTVAITVSEKKEVKGKSPFEILSSDSWGRDVLINIRIHMNILKLPEMYFPSS